MCVEVVVDGAHRTLQTWVDGILVPGLVVDATPIPDVDATWLMNTSWVPQLIDARFGWESYGGQAETLWFDDVVIAASRVGC